MYSKVAVIGSTMLYVEKFYMSGWLLNKKLEHGQSTNTANLYIRFRLDELLTSRH